MHSQDSGFTYPFLFYIQKQNFQQLNDLEFDIKDMLLLELGMIDPDVPKDFDDPF